MTKNEKFIEKAKLKHGDRYDYSKVEYINAKTKISIVCTEHGEFLQIPNDHLNGSGCPKCANFNNAINKTKNTIHFIKISQKIHKNKYDYSKTNYINSKSNVCIICPIHGEFWQQAGSHANGHGCKKCIPNATDTECFIDKSRKIHGDKYDYSKVEYVNSKTKVCIICQEHREFMQTPNSHLNGRGCSKCSGSYMDYNYFIEKATEKHHNKYDYSKVDYINYNTKICVICPIHGEFWQKPSNHLSGQGCPKCIGLNKTNDEIISEFKKIHGEKYDYSKINYVTSKQKVKIICPEHGEFWQAPNAHLVSGCLKCGRNSSAQKNSKSMDDFLIEAKRVHGDKYDYSKTVYIDSSIKINIICKEHGKFQQNPNNHLRGQGCPICSESKGEKIVKNILLNKKISFTQNYKFDDCRDKRKLPFDFYLPNHNICIEYDGIQHFNPIERFGGVKELESIQKRDQIKTDYCAKNNIKLIRIPYTEFNNIENILKQHLKYGT